VQETREVPSRVSIELRDVDPKDATLKIYEAELRALPENADLLFAISNLYKAPDERLAKILTTLRFLSLERTGSRSETASKELASLLSEGVHREDGGRVQISLEPDPDSELGFRADSAAILALSSIAHEEEGADSELEHYVTQISLIIEFLGHLRPASPADHFVAEQLTPFFQPLLEEDLVEGLARRVLAPLDLPGGSEWFEENRDTVARVDEHLGDI